MESDAETFTLTPNGWVPNNQTLPVRLYRGVETGGCEAVASAFERRFAAHGWVPDWRDTIYDYQHYHSTTHEVVGIAAGHAVLMLGGPEGWIVRMAAGDALMLPAGTGHCRIDGSEDFLAVGAYPEGKSWDVCRDAPSAETLVRIRGMPPAERDPVTGR